MSLDLLELGRRAPAQRLTVSDLPVALRRHARFDAPLAPLTTFRIGGPADCFVEPHTAAELAAVVSFAAERDVPLHVLGNGSNLLVGDAGVRGIVVSLRAMRSVRFVVPGVNAAAQSARGAPPPPKGLPGLVVAQAGASLEALVKRACGAGLAGLEGLAGVPATVGGAVAMNAGTRAGEVADALDRVLVVSPAGRLEVLGRGEIGYAYRRSSLRGCAVVEAVFRLTTDDPTELRERRGELMRAKIKAQPFQHASAGCVFKNLAKPGHPAGWMIDKAGCKGLSVAGASVSMMHANFITNDSRAATSASVMRLIDKVRERVARHFYVDLDLELELWGEAA